ncbi:hypothetical protein J6590_079366 [Homalodisca vitripennis]|nr:hypothetical protein J6590_079366 [Homalodisca vitripennis]
MGCLRPVVVGGCPFDCIYFDISGKARWVTMKSWSEPDGCNVRSKAKVVQAGTVSEGAVLKHNGQLSSKSSCNLFAQNFQS